MRSIAKGIRVKEMDTLNIKDPDFSIIDNRASIIEKIKRHG